MPETHETQRPIYPEIKAQLIGRDGNAFAIIGTVRKAMRRAGVGAAAIEEFSAEALSGDYGDVLSTCSRWVSVT